MLDQEGGLQALPLHNTFFLLPDDHEKEATTSNMLCKTNKAMTKWRKCRDRILFDYLCLQSDGSKGLILVNSVNDVNMTLAWLRSSFHENCSVEESKFAGIGRSPATIFTLQADFVALFARPARIIVLSAPIAILGLFHGFLSLSAFDSVIFADARGANQSHPFCLMMNYFYTPLRLCSRIIGFSTLPRREEVEADVFSRRGWIRQLKHWNRTFQSVLMAVDGSVEVVDDFLDSNDAISTCFKPLNLLETWIGSDSLSIESAVIVNNKDELYGAFSSASSPIILNNFLCHTAEDAVELLGWLDKAQQLGIQRIIHCHQNAKFVGQLSMIALQRRMIRLEGEETGHLQELIRQTEALLGQQIHYQSTLDIRGSFDDTSSFIPPSPDTKLPVTMSSLSFHPLPHLRLESDALACPASAIGFLVRACTLLPLDPSTGQRQTIRLKSHRVFPVNESGKKITTSCGHISQLFLPPALASLVGTDCLQGTLQMTRLAAQASVALKAVLLLQRMNVLDPNFMLCEPYRGEAEVDCEDAVDVEADPEADDEDDESSSDSSIQLSFNEIIPKACTLEAAKEFLYIYALEYTLHGELPFTMTPDSRILRCLSAPEVEMFNCRKSSKTWAVLLPTALPQDFLPVQVPLGSQHILQVNLKLIGQMDMKSSEYSRLLQAQPLLFNLFNMRPLTAPPLSEEDASIQKETSNVPEDKLSYYLIAPLTDGVDSTNNRNLSDLHSKFLKFIADFQAAPFEGAQIAIPDADEVCKKNWSLDWNLITRLEEHDSDVRNDNLLQFLREIEAFTKEIERPEIIIEEGAPPVTFSDFCLHNLLLHTPHTHTLYRSKHIATDVNPTSSSPMSVSFAEYAQNRYGLRTQNPEQPLLQVHRPENWSDLAVWGSTDGAQKDRKKSSRKKRAAQPGEHRSLLIPEHVNILPIGYAQVRTAMLIPRVAGEVERQLRIAEFFSLPQLSGLPRPSHARAVEAMTSTSVALSYSYERLEVLGDGLLKHLSTLQSMHGHGVWNEGRLSSHRQTILSNANLRAAGERIGVFYYASFTPFLVRLWTAAPALKRLLLSESDSSYSSKLEAVRIKTIFDEEDRWLALAALEGKHSQKIGPLFLTQSGALEQPPATQLQTRAEKKGMADVLYRHGQAIPPKKIADVIEALMGAYYLECGVSGAIGFMHAIGVIDADIVTAALMKSSLKVEFFASVAVEPEDEPLEKLKRRRLTPLTAKMIELAPKSTSTAAPSNIKLSAASIDLHQQLANTAPVMTPFEDFPFSEIEDILEYRFEDRRLLFAAFSHCTAALEDYGDFERLEWVGDAALDFMICRVFWYSLDDCNLYPEEREISLATLQSPQMDPDTLTRARQSIINNDALAAIISHFKLHPYIRINSPHLQQEVAKYTNSQESPAGNISTSLQDLDNPLSMTAPKVLADVFEALAGAILIDCGCDDLTFCRVLAKFFNWYRSQELQAQKVFCNNPIEQLLHWYARLGVPRNQITFTFDEIGREKILGYVGRVWVRERCVGEAQAANRQLAKRMAMEDALERLKRDGWRDHL